jgi:HlyD family secretion protein
VQPAQTRSLSFTVAGTVESVSVRPGTTVTPGQALAKVDDTDAAKAVDDAQSALNEARSALTQARAEASKSTAAAGGCGSAGGRQGQSGQCGGVDPIFSAEERVTQATTTLADAEDALEGATITAPIAGRILRIAGKVGTQVAAGSTFITVADVYDMQISAAFPEADADRLAVKQKGVVSLADRAGEEFKATVVQVDPTGTNDGTMVRYGVLLAFDDEPRDLLVGQSASVRVTTGSRSGVLRLPSTAVHDVHGDSGTVLKGGVQLVVGVGLRGDQYTEITSGLAAGDRVVRSW